MSLTPRSKGRKYCSKYSSELLKNTQQRNTMVLWCHAFLPLCPSFCLSQGNQFTTLTCVLCSVCLVSSDWSHLVLRLYLPLTVSWSVHCLPLCVCPVSSVWSLWCPLVLFSSVTDPDPAPVLDWTMKGWTLTACSLTNKKPNTAFIGLVGLLIQMCHCRTLWHSGCSCGSSM